MFFGENIHSYTAGIIRKCWGFEGIGVGCRFMAEILFFGMEMVGDVAMKTEGGCNSYAFTW